MKIVVFKKVADLYRHAANVFAQQAKQAIHAHGRFVVFLSGGRSPLPLYQLLAEEPYRSQLDWRRVFVGWSDERCVSPDHTASNYQMAHEALLSLVPIPDDQILRIDGEDDPEHTASAYEAKVRCVIGAEPAVDLCLLGLGADGHTASLFPAHPALREEDRWFVPVNQSALPQPTRISATLPFLDASNKVLFLVTGSEKAHALARIRNGAFLPAGLVRPQGGNAVWLVDQAATSQSGKNR